MPLTITEVLDILELYFQQEQRGTITRAEFSSLSKQIVQRVFTKEVEKNILTYALLPFDFKGKVKTKFALQDEDITLLFDIDIEIDRHITTTIVKSWNLFILDKHAKKKLDYGVKFYLIPEGKHTIIDIQEKGNPFLSFSMYL